MACAAVVHIGNTIKELVYAVESLSRMVVSYAAPTKTARKARENCILTVISFEKGKIVDGKERELN